MTLYKLVLFSCVVGCLGGCAQPPKPVVEEPPLQYEDPAIPPTPVSFTNQIRDVAVIETHGSRGGAALRAQEDLDVLGNDHYVGVETPITDENAHRYNAAGNAGKGKTGERVQAGQQSTLGQSKNTSPNDKSIYRKANKQDKSVYATTKK